MQVQSLGWEGHLRRKWQSTPVFLPGESHGQRSLVGYSPQGHKELDATEVTQYETTHACTPAYFPSDRWQYTMGYILRLKKNNILNFWLLILHIRNIQNAVPSQEQVKAEQTEKSTMLLRSMGWRDKQVNTGNHSSPEQKFISRNLHRNQCHGESESEVAQSCLTLRDPMDCSPPGSSAHGIFQARVLEWVAISFSRGSSQTRDQTQVSCTAGRCFTI